MTYNIAFFADPHIGYRAKVKSDASGTNIRVADGYEAFREIIEQIITSDPKIDAVVIAGDLFHYSHPTIKDISTVQYYLRKLAEHKIPVYILAGNHDATDIRSELAANAAVDDPDRGIYSLFAPYQKYELTDGIILHSVAHHGLSADKAPQVEASSADINIFTTHGAALDPKNQDLLRCADSPREQIVPIDLITSDLFSAKLLGHYHSRYAVGGEALNTWYSGSTLRRGFSDAPGDRGWLMVQVEVDGSVKFIPKNIHQRSQYDLKLIDAVDLNAGDIMELIEQNLAGTRETEDAPIIRQKVVNATRATRDALDRSRIAELSNHALQWQLEFTNNLVTKHEITDEKKLSFTKKTNIVEQYSSWIKEYETNISSEYKDIVVADAEEYLKRALDGEVLDDNH
jgi:DNA repair exonuclease SbcCD nuclease subunit